MRTWNDMHVCSHIYHTKTNHNTHMKIHTNTHPTHPPHTLSPPSPPSPLPSSLPLCRTSRQYATPYATRITTKSPTGTNMATHNHPGAPLLEVEVAVMALALVLVVLLFSGLSYGRRGSTTHIPRVLAVSRVYTPTGWVWVWLL